MAIQRSTDSNVSAQLLDKLPNERLAEKADRIRKQVVDVSVKNGSGHIAPSLSTIDILTALYYRVINVAASPEWEGRDRVVFSKGHGCYGLYVILADRGYIDPREWDRFYQGSLLSGCVERSVKHGIEAGCGSLGHGLPMAVGLAFGAKLQAKKFRVYCLVGDGEMQEGSNWEAVQFAVKHQLSNLTVIVDNNKLQAMDFLEKVLTVEKRENDLQQKFEAFGFISRSCNGHDPREIASQLTAWISESETIKTPQVLLAKTVKGYGLRCMENVPKFHFRLPTDEDLRKGIRYEDK